MSIKEVTSPGGELMKLHETVEFKDAIEQWFTDIESKMKKTVENNMTECILD